MKSYDVIVIGAGHNGLIVASKLAASGRKVLLIEASETFGGMARSEVLFKDFQVPELASNAVGISKDVVRDLGLNKYDLLFNDEGLKTVGLSLENENIIFGAGLDVFESEPIDENNPLKKNKKVLLSPHSATFTNECKSRMSIETTKNIINFFENKLDKSMIVRL